MPLVTASDPAEQSQRRLGTKSPSQSKSLSNGCRTVILLAMGLSSQSCLQQEDQGDLCTTVYQERGKLLLLQPVAERRNMTQTQLLQTGVPKRDRSVRLSTISEGAEYRQTNESHPQRWLNRDSIGSNTCPRVPTFQASTKTRLKMPKKSV